VRSLPVTIVVAAFAVSAPPETFRPPEVTVVEPLVVIEPPLTQAPEPNVAAFAMVRLPAADLPNVPVVVIALPLRATVPAALFTVSDEAWIPLAVPESTVIVLAVPIVAASPCTKTMFEPVPSCCQLAVV
jgi:hypothetical protein